MITLSFRKFSCTIGTTLFDGPAFRWILQVVVGIFQEVPKLADIVLEVVFPQKIAHVS